MEQIEVGYDLTLQTAVNMMVEDIWQQSALVLLDLRQGLDSHCRTICLDSSIISDLLYTATGIYVWLFLPLQKQGSEVEFEITYSEITKLSATMMSWDTRTRCARKVFMTRCPVGPL